MWFHVRHHVKRHDLLFAFYGLWLAAVTVVSFGWPWQW